jgi:hypothetical protein
MHCHLLSKDITHTHTQTVMEKGTISYGVIIILVTRHIRTKLKVIDACAVALFLKKFPSLIERRGSDNDTIYDMIHIC